MSKEYFIAKDIDGTIILSGDLCEDGSIKAKWLIPRQRPVKTLNDVLMHKKIYDFHWLKPFNESTTRKKYSVEGVPVTYCEWLIFDHLHQNVGAISSRAVLVAAIRTFGKAKESSFKVLLCTLRKKIAKVGWQIRYVRGKGYFLEKIEN